MLRHFFHQQAEHLWRNRLRLREMKIHSNKPVPRSTFPIFLLNGQTIFSHGDDLEICY